MANDNEIYRGEHDDDAVNRYYKGARDVDTVLAMWTAAVSQPWSTHYEDDPDAPEPIPGAELAVLNTRQEIRGIATAVSLLAQFTRSALFWGDPDALTPEHLFRLRRLLEGAGELLAEAYRLVG